MTINNVDIIIENRTDLRFWGISTAERFHRLITNKEVIATKFHFIFAPESEAEAEYSQYGQSPYIFQADARFVTDPLWVQHILEGREDTGRILSHNGQIILGLFPRAFLDKINAGIIPPQLEHIAMENSPELYNHKLRKKQRPFAELLTENNRGQLQRESYFGAYKGVTDILTKYLWPELAYHLTRMAATLRLTPNMVTLVGGLCCLTAFFLFLGGHFIWGSIFGFIFMVLDTVDGKLARCTVTSSFWGNIFDHGIDLIHPPFWWAAWAIGLGAVNLAYASPVFWTVQIIIQGGYILQRLIEGWFIRVAHFHVHVWRPFDSQFRLITARRNPNMVILIGSLFFARPDIGLILVAVWTALSLLVHMIQLLQAIWLKRSGGVLHSWLEG